MVVRRSRAAEEERRRWGFVGCFSRSVGTGGVGAVGGEVLLRYSFSGTEDEEGDGVWCLSES